MKVKQTDLWPRDRGLTSATARAGNFGEVFKATLTIGSGFPITTAVKTLKTADTDARSELLREAALMALFNHKNVVSMIGENSRLLYAALHFIEIASSQVW